MRTVDIHEARLPELLAKVEAGETLVITRCNKPIARLVPTSEDLPGRAPRRIGLARDEFTIPKDFFQPMDDELAGLFAGAGVTADDPLHPDWKPRR